MGGFCSQIWVLKLNHRGTLKAKKAGKYSLTTSRKKRKQVSLTKVSATMYNLMQYIDIPFLNLEGKRDFLNKGI